MPSKQVSNTAVHKKEGKKELMIENHAGGEDCQNCGVTKPKGFECTWCAIKTLEADCLRLSDRIKELEGDRVDFLQTHRKRLADLEFDLRISAQANDRYRKALEEIDDYLHNATTLREIVRRALDGDA